jgi:hypothetical protein
LLNASLPGSLNTIFRFTDRHVVTLVIGRRGTDTARQALGDFYRRTDGDPTPLMTSSGVRTSRSWTRETNTWATA